MEASGNIKVEELKAHSVVHIQRCLGSLAAARWCGRGGLGEATRVAVLAGSFAIVSVHARAADPPADIEHGRALAQTWCSQCHTVDAGDRQQRADGLASFSALANDPRNTPDRLRAFLTRPHGQMPDLNLSRQDRDDLVAYLVSMKGERTH